MTNPAPWTRAGNFIKSRLRAIVHGSQLEEIAGMSKSAKLTVEVWYDPETPNVIQLSSEDARLTDENGRRKGIVIGVNVNRQPKTFARLDALLRSEGVRRP